MRKQLRIEFSKQWYWNDSFSRSNEYMFYIFLTKIRGHSRGVVARPPYALNLNLNNEFSDSR